jgi:hypothetical protein
MRIIVACISLIHSELRSAREAPRPPNIMIMYFIGALPFIRTVNAVGSRSEPKTRIQASQRGNFGAPNEGAATTASANESPRAHRYGSRSLKANVGSHPDTAHRESNREQRKTAAGSLDQHGGAIAAAIDRGAISANKNAHLPPPFASTATAAGW